MAGFDYNKSAATALGLLRQFGQPVTLRRVISIVSDPVAGSVGGTPQTIQTTGARTRLAVDFFEGSRVEVGDQMWLLSNEQAPRITDVLLLDNVPWPILAIQEISPAGIPVLYKVLVGVR